MDSSSKNITYQKAGVDINQGNLLVQAIKPLAQSTHRAGANTKLGGFAGCFDLKATGLKDPILVSSTDGVGTKLKIAIDLDNHDTIGIDLVAMCVNDLIVQGAEPLFFLDYYATGKLNPTRDLAIIKGIAEGCRQAGCALIGGETAEMPGLYKEKDYDLAGFAVGATERENLLPSPHIKEGDFLLGLASSGVHSNGFSLIRHIISEKNLHWSEEAPFCKGKTLGEALLTPTRIYVRSVLETIRKFHGSIKALAHITGGGLHENIPRILPEHCTAHINLKKITPGSLFSWLARTGPVDSHEMIRTFNCGVGMVLVVEKTKAEEITKTLNQMGETTIALGNLIRRQTQGHPIMYDGEISFQ